VSTGDQQRWESEAARRPRVWWILSIAILVLVGGVALLYPWNRKTPDTTNITASSGRLTFETDGGASLTAVNRQAKPEVLYRVTLENAPLGSKLTLKCEWFTPSGNLAHQNCYQTPRIDKETWTTHDRYRFSPASPAGVWSVKLSLDDRELHSLPFQVRDGNGEAHAPEKMLHKNP
jgi:hypothetical protein